MSVNDPASQAAARAPFDASDLRCVRCDFQQLLPVEPAEAGQAAFHCSSCGSAFAPALGVPYFGDFETDDVLGLIEIAANAANRGRFGVTPESVEHWDRLAAAYDLADDKTAFIAGSEEAQSPYFFNRFGEWTEIAHLTRDLDLRGLKVLDMGAGAGFDSHRLALRGARVTALEFSPLLAESGMHNFPGIRWIGGFSHCLPFQSATFDAVFCNAALHHMRDIPAAISEALRVLRPGGFLITTCDSFRPSTSPESDELDVFDRDTSVLLGVNERVPTFVEFVEVLTRHPRQLAVEIFTHTLYDAPSGGILEKLTAWNLEKSGPMLSRRFGSLAMRVKLLATWTEPAGRQASSILSARQYVSWMTSASAALVRLAPLLREGQVDLPFPGRGGSKFELLNGWRLARPPFTERLAYRRARWFLRRPQDMELLSFTLALPDGCKSSSQVVTVSVNGSERGKYAVTATGQCRATLHLGDRPPGETFVVEMQLVGGDDSLGGASFAVRNRRYSAGVPLDPMQIAQGPRKPGAERVFAVIPVFNRLDFTRQCIVKLKGQTWSNLSIIVADGGSSDGTVDAIRTEHPDVAVLTSPNELWWAGAMAMGIDHVLGLDTGRHDCVLMMNNDTEIGVDYVERLIGAQALHGSAVGALIVDCRDPNRVLDAGEYIDWASYSFPVKDAVASDESYCGDVDVLPGRGSVVPIWMIRAAGNVDAGRFPHYLADYEFFYRLKQSGFSLGVCYEARLLAHIEETGIVPTTGGSSFRSVWRELFSRRSMSNVVDHWRFAGLHAPDGCRNSIRLKLAKRVAAELTLRTPLRPLFQPVYWILRLPPRVVRFVGGQQRALARFGRSVEETGAEVLCNPQDFPGLIRLPLYLAASPGPMRPRDVARHGLILPALLERGVLRPLRMKDWYVFQTLQFESVPDVGSVRRLLRFAWNPVRKICRTIEYRRDLRQAFEETGKS